MSTSARSTARASAAASPRQDILQYLEDTQDRAPRRCGASGRGAPAARRTCRPIARRAGRGAADAGDAQEDRRAHDVQPADVCARALGVRDRFHRVSQIREQKKAEYERAGAKLTFMAFIARAVVRRPAGDAGAQRLDRRRQHRLQEGHQPRHRGRSRLGADRAGHQERGREEPARVSAGRFSTSPAARAPSS